MSQTTDAPKQTLDQRRANHAWNAVTSLAKIKDDKRLYDEDARMYAREAKKLPARIIGSGLGQALAFVLAKAKERKSLAKLHKDLTEWVIEKRGIRGEKRESLLESIVHGNSTFLRHATEESLLYLQWLNRFTEAEGLTEGD